MLFTTIGSILTGLLKIVGITLLSLVLLLILLILLIIFAPVFYKINISKDDVDLKITCSCSWSAALVYAKYCSTKNEDKAFIFRILGISYKRWGKVTKILSNVFKHFHNKRKCKDREEVRQKKSDKSKVSNHFENEELFNEEENYALFHKEGQIQSKDSDDNISIDKIKCKNNNNDMDALCIDYEDSKRKSIWKQVIDKIKRLYSNLKSFIENVISFLKKTQRIIGQLLRKSKTAIKKIKRIYNFLADKDNKAGISTCFNSVKKLLKEILPRKIKGDISFGTDDPYLTGQILGLLGITYSLYGDKINIHPDFERGLFVEGNILINGHIQLFTLIKICIKLYRDDDFKKLYNNYKLL